MLFACVCNRENDGILGARLMCSRLRCEAPRLITIILPYPTSHARADLIHGKLGRLGADARLQDFCRSTSRLTNLKSAFPDKVALISLNYFFIIPSPAGFAAMLTRRALFANRSSPFRICLRCKSTSRITNRPVPPPTPFIPDVPTFLKVIGRGLGQHAAKFTSWEALFKLTSAQLREIGIEPPRARRYLLWWREKFRRGEYGIGGDFTEVTDGVGEMRVFEVPVSRRYAPKASVTTSEGMRKVVINVPKGEEKPVLPPEQATPVKHVKVRYDHTICGPYVRPVLGTRGYAAKVAVQEGIWEERRGHKVDGGERRKAEVRAKRRAEARKAAEQ